RIDPDTISDPACCELLDRFRSTDIDVAVWDVTSDTGVPAMLVWIMEGDKRERLLGRPSVGAGCHPVREIALSRALSEAAQERLTLITGSRDDLRRDDYRDMDFADVFARTDGRDFAGTPTTAFQTSSDDVAWLLKQLRQVGIDEVILVDLSQDTFRDISVARIVIPGLESAVDNARYVPGRRAQTVMEAGPE
ncbi:MAG: YcaO-like family protein, partial [Pseudomonadota bacterium]